MEKLAEWDDSFIKKVICGMQYYGVTQVTAYINNHFMTVEEPYVAIHNTIKKVMKELETGTIRFLHCNGGFQSVLDVVDENNFEQGDVILSRKGAFFGDNMESYPSTFYIHKGSIMLFTPNKEIELRPGQSLQVDSLSWNAKTLENAVVFKFLHRPTYTNNHYDMDRSILNEYF